MNFWHDFSKLDILIRNGFVEQATAVGREMLYAAQRGQCTCEQAALLHDFCAVNDINISQACLPVMDAVKTPVDGFIEHQKQGISVVTACMNRNENLMKAVQSWLEIPSIDEILIVDWSSERSVYLDLMSLGLNDRRIRVVRVEGQPRWVLTYAFNIGFRLASYDTILKADADIILSQDFFDKNKLERNKFITGDWRIADPNQEHINGFFYITYDDLMKAHGFNEFIATYGWDDDDLYDRLQRLGFQRQQVDPKTIYHLHHDDTQRLSLPETDDVNAIVDLQNDVLYQIRANRFIANSMPVWGRRSGFLPASIVRASAQYLVVEQTAPSFHKVAQHIIEDSRYYSAAELISWRTSRRVYDLPKQKFWAYLAEKRLSDLHRLDVSVLLYTDRQVQFDCPFWMINFYVDAIDAYFHQQDFLENLNKFCCQLQINVVARVSDAVFAQCNHYFRKYERLFCIPVSEAYGAIDFLPTPEAIDLFKKGKNSPRHHTGSNIKLNVMSELIDAMETAFLHKRPDTAKVSRRKVYIDAQHGLGNRLRAIASGAAIAQKTDRELVVVWEPDHHCEARLNHLYEYEGVVVDKSMLDELGSDVATYNYMETEPDSKKDALVLLDHDRDIYVRTSCVLNSPLTSWDAENLFLKTLNPTRQVKQLIEPFDLSCHVGVHIRMEGAKGLDDHSYEDPENWSEDGLQAIRYWRDKSHYSHFIKRIDRLLEAEPDTKIFLATDQADTYRIFKELYADRLDYLEREDFDRSEQQIIYALADAMLLGRCNRLLGSTWSSFSEMAMRLSGGFDAIEMSGKDF